MTKTTKRLFRLARKKKRLLAKASKIAARTTAIDKEVLTYKGTGGWGQDIFIRCLVENLHFTLED